MMLYHWETLPWDKTQVKFQLTDYGSPVWLSTGAERLFITGKSVFQKSGSDFILKNGWNIYFTQGIFRKGQGVFILIVKKGAKNEDIMIKKGKAIWIAEMGEWLFNSDFAAALWSIQDPRCIDIWVFRTTLASFVLFNIFAKCWQFQSVQVF